MQLTSFILKISCVEKSCLMKQNDVLPF